MILEDFDENKFAVINAFDIVKSIDGFPKIAVSCFSRVTFDRLVRELKGVKKLIVFGPCGVLESSIDDCSIIIPNIAIRDEGTSFHYAPHSDEIAVNMKYIDTFANILDHHNLKYNIGKVWTTDGIYI